MTVKFQSCLSLLAGRVVKEDATSYILLERKHASSHQRKQSSKQVGMLAQIVHRRLMLGVLEKYGISGSVKTGRQLTAQNKFEQLVTRAKGGAPGILPRRQWTASRHYFWETVGDGEGELECRQGQCHWS